MDRLTFYMGIKICALRNSAACSNMLDISVKFLDRMKLNLAHFASYTLGALYVSRKCTAFVQKIGKLYYHYLQTFMWMPLVLKALHFCVRCMTKILCVDKLFFVISIQHIRRQSSTRNHETPLLNGGHILRYSDFIFSLLGFILQVNLRITRVNLSSPH